MFLGSYATRYTVEQKVENLNATRIGSPDLGCQSSFIQTWSSKSKFEEEGASVASTDLTAGFLPKNYHWRHITTPYINMSPIALVTVKYFTTSMLTSN